MVATTAWTYPPESAKGDISARATWIACALLYAALMAVAWWLPDIYTGPGPGYELGLAESLQNITLALAVILALITLRQADTAWLRGWLILVALGVFWLLGEEISWGQHYLGWETTGWFAQVNDQGETNIHNTPDGWFDQKPRMVLQLGMILGAIVHPLMQLMRNGRGLFDRPWWLAPTAVCAAPVVFSLIAGAPKAIDKLSILPFELQFYRASEMEECFMYVFFVVYLLSLGARLRFRRAQHG